MTEIRLKAMLEKLLKDNPDLTGKLPDEMSLSKRVDFIARVIAHEYPLEEIYDLRFKDGNIGVRRNEMSARDFFKHATLNYLDSLLEPYAIEHLTSGQIEKIAKQTMPKLNRAMLEAVVESMQLFED